MSENYRNQIIRELIQPYLFEPVNPSLAEQMAESIADNVGFDTTCKINDQRLDFEIHCDPSIQFSIIVGNCDEEG
jgi:hypothetical protein